ncbi:uncharacterized protein J5F26_006134 isoform 1-T1 [Ciconia maguari]
MNICLQKVLTPPSSNNSMPAKETRCCKPCRVRPSRGGKGLKTEDEMLYFTQLPSGRTVQQDKSGPSKKEFRPADLRDHLLQENCSQMQIRKKFGKLPAPCTKTEIGWAEKGVGVDI